VDEDTLNLVNAGIIDSTVAQKPFTMAYYGLKQLDEIHHYPLKSLMTVYSVDSFSPLPSFVDTGTSLVDKSNVDIFLKARADSQAK
jgi:ribose transport system substrate-binding protein